MKETNQEWYGKKVGMNLGTTGKEPKNEIMVGTGKECMEEYGKIQAETMK